LAVPERAHFTVFCIFIFHLLLPAPAGGRRSLCISLCVAKNEAHMNWGSSCRRLICSGPVCFFDEPHPFHVTLFLAANQWRVFDELKPGLLRDCVVSFFFFHVFGRSGIPGFELPGDELPCVLFFGGMLKSAMASPFGSSCESPCGLIVHGFSSFRFESGAFGVPGGLREFCLCWSPCGLVETRLVRGRRAGAFPTSRRQCCR